MGEIHTIRGIRNSDTLHTLLRRKRVSAGRSKDCRQKLGRTKVCASRNNACGVALMGEIHKFPPRCCRLCRSPPRTAGGSGLGTYAGSCPSRLSSGRPGRRMGGQRRSLSPSVYRTRLLPRSRGHARKPLSSWPGWLGPHPNSRPNRSTAISAGTGDRRQGDDLRPPLPTQLHSRKLSAPAPATRSGPARVVGQSQSQQFWLSRSNCGASRSN